MNVDISATKGHRAVGIAKSKLILMGEHAVVYGEPAIAIPFPMVGVRVTITYTPGVIDLQSALFQGPLTEAPPELAGIQACIYETMRYVNLPLADLSIQIQSSIPFGKGLGSSASVAIAIVRSLFAYQNRSYTQEELLRLANVSEEIAHGNPSGIDALAVAAKNPIWFETGHATSEIHVTGEFHFVVVDTGQVSDTRLTVQSVAELLRKAPEKMKQHIQKLGQLTHRAKKALEETNQNILGRLLDAAQIELESLGVSNTRLNQLIHQARKEGALGAKLTGAGNGGCLIALANDESHAKQLAKSLLSFGAEAAWTFALRNNETC